MSRSGRQFFVLILNILLAAFVLFQGYQLLSTRPVEIEHASPAPVAPIMDPPSTSWPKDLETIPVPSTGTPSLVEPTQTPAFSATHDFHQVHGLEVPIRAGKQTYLIHRVNAGETFETIAKAYSTTVGVIQALNFNLQPPLWANDTIVISPGTLSLAPASLSFETYQVMEQEILIDNLAEKLKVDSAQLRYYNACSDNCPLAAGDWLMIPQPK